MALSDCSKCWETPCVCGHEYKSWPLKRKLEVINAILSTFSKEDNDKSIMSGKEGKLHFVAQE